MLLDHGALDLGDGTLLVIDRIAALDQAAADDFLRGAHVGVPWNAERTINSVCALLRAKFETFVDELVPCRWRAAVVNLRHRDATRDRTHDLTEIATDAFALIDARHARTFRWVNALVRAVVARGHAELTANALVSVDLRNCFVI